MVRLRPRPGEEHLRTEDVVDYLDREGDRVALLLLGGVNYLTGELMDLPAITRAGHRAGALVGWDLAHAAGNVPLALHDWGVDFAAWCTYKYLNSGPGAPAGVFIHERHLGDPTIQRFEGWWGNDPATRFEMAPVARSLPTADAWLISNPPILAMAPVRTSLELFDSVGMPALRARSERLTGYLERLLDEVIPTRPLAVVTPRDPARRGCQLSVRLRQGSPASLAKRLRHEYGVIADAREPDIVRLAPVPLYSTYHDCWRAADALAQLFEEERAETVMQWAGALSRLVHSSVPARRWLSWRSGQQTGHSQRTTRRVGPNPGMIWPGQPCGASSTGGRSAMSQVTHNVARLIPLTPALTPACRRRPSLPQFAGGHNGQCASMFRRAGSPSGDPGRDVLRRLGAGQRAVGGW